MLYNQLPIYQTFSRCDGVCHRITESLHHEYPRVFESRDMAISLQGLLQQDLRVDDRLPQIPDSETDFFGLNRDFLMIPSFYMHACAEMGPMNQERLKTMNDLLLRSNLFPSFRLEGGSPW
jgi:hypothetical protein